MALNPLNPEFYRKIFFIVFLVLVVTIIMTPLLIRRGFSFFDEEIFESFLLLIQVAIAWRVFRLYENSINIKEKAMEKLEEEYQKREKELLETFAYLGKVNVQISLIKDFLGKLKVPRSKKEMKDFMDDILQMALAVGKKNWLTVRMINTDNMQTISEYWAKNTENRDGDFVKVGNREIIEMSKDKNLCNRKGFCVLASAGSRPEEKAFLIYKEDGRTDHEVMEFLKAAVNQCEIVHTLFKLNH
jgi:hypothetical protein